jgi:serine/threonine protein kinase
MGCAEATQRRSFGHHITIITNITMAATASSSKSMTEVNDQFDFANRQVSTGRGIHRGILRVQKDADVFEKYEVVEEIGQGSMGHVCKVKIKETQLGGSAFGPKKRRGGFFFGCSCMAADAVVTNNPTPRFTASQRSKHGHFYALKSIQLDRISPVFIDELKNEIAILRSMDHANIVKAFEVYITNQQIFLILEACDGDLYTRAPYTERVSARMIAQITSAVAYMHERAIVHRDLKVRFVGVALPVAKGAFHFAHGHLFLLV